MEMSTTHRTKYANFLKMIEESKTNGAQVVLVAEPYVLGDTYDEVITNLGLLSEAKMMLLVAH